MILVELMCKNGVDAEQMRCERMQVLGFWKVFNMFQKGRWTIHLKHIQGQSRSIDTSWVSKCLSLRQPGLRA